MNAYATLFICLIFGLPTLLQANDNSESSTFSPANTLLFVTEHMRNMPIDKPYTYRFTQSGSEEEAYSDAITLTVTQKNQQAVATVQFFSGDQQRWTPEFTDPKGNPVLALYLQRDIQQMEKLTGGQWRHFQKQIKLALEENATITETEVNYQGKSYPAKMVTIKPYINDPYKDKFPRFMNKQYQLTFADNIPGQLYSIHASLTDAEGKLLLDDKLVLQ